MNVSPANIAPAPPASPQPPAIAGSAAGISAKTVPATAPAEAAAFQALFKIAQLGPKSTPATSTQAAPKKSDPKQAAILPIFTAFQEILAFGSATPQDDESQPQDQTAMPSLPTEPQGTAAMPKVISLLGAALLPRGTDPDSVNPLDAQKPGIAAPEADTKPQQQSAFDLKLTPESPASDAPPAASPRDAATTAAIAAPIIAQTKSQPSESNTQIPDAALTSKIDTAAPAPPAGDSAAPAPQPQPHAAEPARIERPSEIVPVEARPVPQSSPRDITVRLSDLQQRSTDVRFVERAGQVHVSVRTNDAEFGRTLRGGLNELMTRLDHAGIKAEFARGSDSASLKNNTRSPNDEQSGSGARRDQRDRRQNNGNSQSWIEEFQNLSDSNGGTNA